MLSGPTPRQRLSSAAMPWPDGPAWFHLGTLGASRRPGFGPRPVGRAVQTRLFRVALAALLIGTAIGCGSAASETGSGASADAWASLGPVGRTERARVVRIVDGDTIIVDRGRGNERLRYIGIDTPETVKPDTPVAWMGPQATAANQALVAGREVVLERDVSETDKYDRLLRYVWLESDAGWLMVNVALLRRGVAQVTTYPPDVAYVERFLQAQRAARDAGAGLWGSPPP